MIRLQVNVSKTKFSSSLFFRLKRRILESFAIKFEVDRGSKAGVDPEISERGGGRWKPNSRKGGPEFDFSVRLSVIFL